MGQPKYKTRCPLCEAEGRDKNGDNLVVYEDGSDYCFSHGTSINTSSKVKKIKDYMEEEKVNDVKLLTDIFYDDLKSRGISASTCQKFSYGKAKYTGYIGKEELKDTLVHVVSIKDELGKTIGQKLRGPNKSFKVIGKAGSNGLFFKELWSPNENLTIIITEGEIDALSVAEAQGCKYPVVSLKNGAASAKDAIKKESSYLNGFKYVVFAFDNDDTGRKAVEQCISELEPGKVKIVTWPEDVKDANDLHRMGRRDELLKCIINAKTVRPDSIVNVSDIIDKALEPVEQGLSWPWPDLNRPTYGIQKELIYTFGGGSGNGKTEVFKEIAVHLAMHHKQQVGIISLEQNPSTTLKALAGVLLNKRLHVPGALSDENTKNEARKAMEKLSEYVHFYDHFGAQNLNVIINQIRYFVKVLGVKYVFLDHLTALSAGMSDDRKGLDDAMAKLASLVQELKFTLFVVSHLAKPNKTHDNPKSWEQGREVTPDEFRGSNAILYWSGFMVGLERNRLDPNPIVRNTLKFRILKDRFTGEADGLCLDLNFNPETGRLTQGNL